MLYKYLTTQDIDIAFKDAILQQIINGKTDMVFKAEKYAIGEIKSKLSNRYDVAKIFFKITTWNNQDNYVLDDVIYLSPNLYTCKQANSNAIPTDEANESKWEKEDTRYEIIIAKMLDLIPHFLYKSVNPRKIPREIRDAYNDAMFWLEEVKDGNESPDLPKLENGADQIEWGSQLPQNYIY